jgi:hypothetical protein
LARSSRSTFLAGRLNVGPYRIGVSINPASKPYLKATRMRWIHVPVSCSWEIRATQRPTIVSYQPASSRSIDASARSRSAPA